MPIKDQRIDLYIEKSEGFAKPILAYIRELVHSCCPDVVETWKWSFPHFMYHDEILCSMAAFKNHCAFRFWKAALLADESHVLSITERNAMGHMGKVESIQDLPDEAVFRDLIMSAMKLNEEKTKLPPRTKTSEIEKKELTVPDYFLDELAKNAFASINFDKFPYSHKKEYINWLNEAKTEETRKKRMAQAIEMIAEGKDRNWKYKKC